MAMVESARPSSTCFIIHIPDQWQPVSGSRLPWLKQRITKGSNSLLQPIPPPVHQYNTLFTQ
jgi:hypothetical protein